MKKLLRSILLVLACLLGLAVLVALSPLLLILLLIPVSYCMTMQDSKYSGYVRYGLLRIPIDPSEKPKPASAPEKKTGKTSGKKTGAKKKKQPLSQTLDMVTKLIKPLPRGLRSLFRHLHLRELVLDIRIGTDNAADTAIRYGQLSALCGALFPWLLQSKSLGTLRIRLTPDFNAQTLAVSGSARFRTRGIWVLRAVLQIAWTFFVLTLRSQMKTSDPANRVERKGGSTMPHTIETLLGTSIQKIKDMVDVNTVIGDPIRISDTITIIPVSRLSFGFASGGSDIPSKSDKALFGGGAGAGVKVDPLAFIVVNNGDVKVIPYSAPPATAPDRAVSLVPEVIDKLSGLFKKDKKQETAADPAEAAEVAAASEETGK